MYWLHTYYFAASILCFRRYFGPYHRKSHQPLKQKCHLCWFRRKKIQNINQGWKKETEKGPKSKSLCLSASTESPSHFEHHFRRIRRWTSVSLQNQIIKVRQQKARIKIKIRRKSNSPEQPSPMIRRQAQAKAPKKKSKMSASHKSLQKSRFRRNLICKLFFNGEIECDHTWNCGENVNFNDEIVIFSW